MNFRIEKSTILNKVSLLDSVVSSKSTLPILDNILFKVDKHSLTLTASDLETTLVAEIGLLQEGENGQVCLPSKLLRTALAKLPDTELFFDINDSTQQCVVTYGSKGSFQIQGYDAFDYPTQDTDGIKNGVNIPQNDLKTMLSKCQPFISADELRPIMNGVLMDSRDNRLTFVATDAHKLIRQGLDISSEEFSVVIPNKATSIIIKSLSNKDTLCSFSTNDKYGMVVMDNYKVIFRLVEGKYPNYDSVIPRNNPISVKALKSTLSDIVGRCSVFASQDKAISLSFKDNNLDISCQDVDYGKKISESMDVMGDDTITINFRSDFLETVISALDNEYVNISMDNPTKACIFYGENLYNVCLLMPIRIA